jgi:hypothetical protein
MNERIDAIERLRRFAEHRLDPSTYERIMLPAIAGPCLTFRRPGAIGADRTRLPSPW